MYSDRARIVVELVPEARQYRRGSGVFGYADSSHSNSAALLANPKPAGDPRSFLKKSDVAGSDTWPVRTRVRGCHVTRLFSVKIPATDSPAFPMWGSRRALPVCEDASVVQNDGISQDGTTCTVIPIVLRALPCCCTVVAHGCADWERGWSLRLIRRVVLQDGVHSGKGAPVKCFTERTGQ